MTLTTQQTEMAKEIAQFAQNRGFDFENGSKESFKEVMKEWLRVGRDFQERFKELPLHQQKVLLGL